MESIEILFIFYRRLGGLQSKKWGGNNKKRGCIVKCEEMLFKGRGEAGGGEVVGEGLVRLAICGSPMETTFIKSWVTLDV